MNTIGQRISTTYPTSRPLRLSSVILSFFLPKNESNPALSYPSSLVVWVSKLSGTYSNIQLDVYLRVLRPLLNRAPSCKCLDDSVMHVLLSYVKDCVWLDWQDG